MATPNIPVLLSQLRSLVTASTARYQFESAAYYANKAVTLSNGAPRDVYAMADALYLNNEPHRAIRTLEVHKLMEPEILLNDAQEHAEARAVAAGKGAGSKEPLPNLRSVPLHVLGAASRVQAEYLPFFYLAALCFKKLKAWDKCIALLEAVMEGPGRSASEPLLTPLQPEPLWKVPAASAVGAAGDKGRNAGGADMTGLYSTRKGGAAVNNNTAAAANAGAAGAAAASTKKSFISSIWGRGKSKIPSSSASALLATPSAGAAAGGARGGKVAAAATPASASSSSSPMMMLFSPSDQWMSPAPPTSSSALLLSGGGAAGHHHRQHQQHLLLFDHQKAEEEEAAAAHRNTTWRLLRMMALHNDKAPTAATNASLLAAADEGEGEGEGDGGGLFYPLGVPREHRLNLVACMCQLRGEALMALGHPTRAKHWFLAAVHLEPQCTEAVQSLLDNHLLTDTEEAALQKSMDGRLSIAFQRLSIVSLPLSAMPGAAANIFPEGKKGVKSGRLTKSDSDNEDEEDFDGDDEEEQDGVGGKRPAGSSRAGGGGLGHFKRQKTRNQNRSSSKSASPQSPANSEGGLSSIDENQQGGGLGLDGGNDDNNDEAEEAYEQERLLPDVVDEERFFLSLYAQGGSAALQQQQHDAALLRTASAGTAARFAPSSMRSEAATPAPAPKASSLATTTGKPAAAAGGNTLSVARPTTSSASRTRAGSGQATATAITGTAETALGSTISTRTRAGTGSGSGSGSSSSSFSSSSVALGVGPMPKTASSSSSTVMSRVQRSSVASTASTGTAASAPIPQASTPPQPPSSSSSSAATGATTPAPGASTAAKPGTTVGVAPASATAARAQLRRTASASSTSGGVGGASSPWAAVLGPVLPQTQTQTQQQQQSAARTSSRIPVPKAASAAVAAVAAASEAAVESGGGSRSGSGGVEVETVTVNYRWLFELLYSMRFRRYTLQKPASSSLSSSSSSSSWPGEDGIDAYCLGTNFDVLSAKAESLLYQHDASSAFAVTRRLMLVDPFDKRTALLHYSSLTSLKQSQELFALAHNAVKANPREALSWFAVGCYYSSVGKHEAACKNFTKATQMEPSHAPSWMGLGHAYAASNEIEPSLAAYRAAMALMPHSHVPPMSMASVSVRAMQLTQAAQFLALARSKCVTDPLLYHESGVLCHKMGDYQGALKHFETVAELTSEVSHSLRRTWEPTFFNMGHALRKLGHYQKAIAAYEHALALIPNNAQTIAALALTHHMAGSFDRAIGHYHAALALDYDDALSQRMLKIALEDSIEYGAITNSSNTSGGGGKAASGDGFISALLGEDEVSADSGDADAALFGGGQTVTNMASSTAKTPLNGGTGGSRLPLSSAGFLRKAPDFSASSTGGKKGAKGGATAPRFQLGQSGKGAAAAAAGGGGGSGGLDHQRMMMAEVADEEEEEEESGMAMEEEEEDEAEL